MLRPALLRPGLLLLLGAVAMSACDSTNEGPARATDTVSVSYVGTLANGEVFDQSAGATFSLQAVIPGFRDGIVGMMVGEEKRLIIPPDQAYGSAGAPPRIPPNATLTFDVRLIAIR